MISSISSRAQAILTQTHLQAYNSEHSNHPERVSYGVGESISHKTYLPTETKSTMACGGGARKQVSNSSQEPSSNCETNGRFGSPDTYLPYLTVSIDQIEYCYRVNPVLLFDSENNAKSSENSLK